MNHNVYLYYCLNSNIIKSKTNPKTGVKSIKIIYNPIHISLRLLYKKTDQDGYIYPIMKKYVLFPDFPSNNKYLNILNKYHWLNCYNLVYNLLFPKPNITKAVQCLQSHNKIIRLIASAIIQNHASIKQFDDWLEKDKTEYLALRY